MTTKPAKPTADRPRSETSKASTGNERSPGRRRREALHKGTDPAYPADEARASDPGREKPQD